jgi:glucose-6-phosphate 1-epimerase
MIEQVAGNGGLPKVVLAHASGATAEVYLHGAHVTSFVPAGGREVLMMSREAVFAPATPIRGGIPVIFPQFSGQGPLPAHGFARVHPWTLVEAGEADGDVCVTLRLTPTPAITALWPHDFVADFTLRLAADRLAVTFGVMNSGAAPFDFQAVLHTYFAIADIAATRVRGLQGTTYLDSLRDTRETEAAPAITFTAETDRIYLATPDRLAIDDGTRTIDIAKRGMPDVVVWNPWIAKSQRLADFGDDDYLRMVCVETGAIAPALTLAPGAQWTGETGIRVG